MPDLAATLAQFGAAGLVAWMWLTERRAAAIREKHLTEAHERLITERQNLTVIVRTLEANTRALTALESGQRTLTGVLERVVRRKR